MLGYDDLGVVDAMVAGVESGQPSAKPGAAASWRNGLQRSTSGAIRQNVHNAASALELAPELVGRVRYDEFRCRATCRDMPWRPGSDWREWTDADDDQLTRWLQREGVPTTPGVVASAVNIVAHDNPIHEVREYLEGLEWDGQARLDSWLINYVGAQPDPTEDYLKDELEAQKRYIEAVGRAFMIGAVARIMRPGCKLDTAPILEGRQGIFKSTAIAALMPSPDWFTDQVAEFGTKDSCHDLEGKWIIEIAELSAMRGKDVEKTKAFMSRSIDHYKRSYGRRSQDVPRQCAFIGTTNSQEYLKDETGNRRFWPVRCGVIDLDAIRRDRNQLWAEAFAAFMAGEPWWLTHDIEAIAGKVQADRKSRDPWHGSVMQIVAEMNEHRIRHFAEPDEVLERLLPQPRDRNQAAKNRLAAILIAANWERKQRRLIKGGPRVWVYVPPVITVTSDTAHTGDETGDKKHAQSLAQPPVSPLSPVESNRDIRKGDKDQPDSPVCGDSKTLGLLGEITGDTGDTGEKPSKSGDFSSPDLSHRTGDALVTGVGTGDIPDDVTAQICAVTEPAGYSCHKCGSDISFPRNPGVILEDGTAICDRCDGCQK